ncbi:DUF1284 domain-containing protein [Notoacmeibacter ruber]|uniref:DUF1284 domain-containing protein n=1 Tax=Notoacmeibacter ruber TaxID=2670375 RepID=A0A3L7JKM3_9HYPH|nr:DUF1284 domain-containing protein [Notoacmeibacter ruber]RLQ89072.1 DUF1284 domain-containing protein [Notoacmeibacter ruber]
MTISLRPHHLLCMLTYIGRGYSPAFVASYDSVIARLSAGEAVLIVDGPDAICAPLLENGEPHCFRQSVIDRDRRAAKDLSPLLGVEITAGTTIALDHQTLGEMRAAFAAGTIRSACAGCQWADLCDAVSGNGFTGSGLLHLK